MDAFFDRLAKALAGPATRRDALRRVGAALGVGAAGLSRAQPASADVCAYVRCTVQGYYSKTATGGTCDLPNSCSYHDGCLSPYRGGWVTATGVYYLIKLTEHDPGDICWEPTFPPTSDCNCF
jgi:hypothetical protein